MHDRQFKERNIEPMPEIVLITLRNEEERYQYENMFQLDWSLVLEKYEEGDRGAVFCGGPRGTRCSHVAH